MYKTVHDHWWKAHNLMLSPVNNTTMLHVWITADIWTCHRPIPSHTNTGQWTAQENDLFAVNPNPQRFRITSGVSVTSTNHLTQCLTSHLLLPVMIPETLQGRRQITDGKMNRGNHYCLLWSLTITLRGTLVYSEIFESSIEKHPWIFKIRQNSMNFGSVQIIDTVFNRRVRNT